MWTNSFLAMKQSAEKILFELLVRAISPRRHMDAGESSAVLFNFDRKEWLSVIALADKSEVPGLAYDAVLTLPKEQQPDTEVMMHWTAKIQSMERDNLLYRSRLKRCFEVFEEHRLEPILLKGLTLSDLYPNPLHRPVGDVDLYVTIDRQHRYMQALEAMGGTVDNAYDLKHLSVQCCGMNWELHFRGTSFYNGTTNRRYRLLEQEETTADALYHETIEGHTVAVFPPILKIVFLTAHFQHHLIMEYVTVRQLVDWMLALHQERTALGIAEVSLLRTLKRLGLFRLYRAMGYVATRHLGLDSNGYAGLTTFSEKDCQRGEMLYAILVNGHPVGCRPYRQRRVSDSVWRRIRHFHELCKRCLALCCLCPQEALATPFGFLYYAFKRRLVFLHE